VLCTLVLAGHAYGQGAGKASPGKPSGYVVDPNWPEKPAEFTWGNMPGVTVDAQDRIYIFTRNHPPVQVYGSDGKLVRTFDSETIKSAHFIRIDHQGHVWIADIGTHTVQKYTPEGKLLLTLGTVGESGCDETHLAGPTDMAVLPSGDVFVSDGYGNRRVVHFDREGKFVKQWGEEGTEPGRFALVHAIAADSKGRLYVADRENSRVQVFAQDGKLLGVWKDTITPWGIFVTPKDAIWICGSSPAKPGEKVVPPPDEIVMKLSPAGKILERHVMPQTEQPPGKPGEVNWVHGIAVDSKGNLYLGDIKGNRAQKFLLRRPGN